MEILQTRKGRRVDPQDTICEVHRRIADLLVYRLSDRPDILKEIMPDLNKAFLMGKRLVLALVEKKISLPDWEANDIEKAVKFRALRNQIVKELNEAGFNL